MSDAPVTSLSCSQCAVYYIRMRTDLSHMSHCGSTVYLDGTVVFTGTCLHAGQRQCRWRPPAGCRGPTIKDLDKNPGHRSKLPIFSDLVFHDPPGRHESIDLEPARQSRSPKSPISIYPQAIYGLTIPESTHSRLLHPCLSRQPRIGCFARIQALRSNRAPWYTCQSTFIVTNTAIKPTPPWSAEPARFLPTCSRPKLKLLPRRRRHYRHSLPMPGVLALSGLQAGVWF